MHSAIVTGADGFIGSHLSKRLSSNGVEVWAMVMQNSPTLHRIDGMKNVHVIQLDYTDVDGCVGKLPNGADVFYHLAWQGVAPEMRNLIDFQMPNIEMGMNMVRLAKKCGASRFVLPGSTFEYLYSEGNINGKSLPTPSNAYGAVKVSSRYLCEQLARELGLPFVYAVITGIYGGGRRDSNVITYTIEKLLSGEKPSLTALEQRWDYVHIDDVTRALIAIGENGKSGAFYSIGHGDNIPLAEYIYKIRDLINPQASLGIGERPYETDRLTQSCVDLTALREDTGFAPQMDFEKGIAEEIENYKKEVVK